MPPVFTQAKVVSIEKIAKTCLEVVFETPTPLTYAPGQFVSIKVADKHFRSYSIFGTLGPNRYGLIVDVKPGGVGSRYFDGLVAGSDLTFLGPVGRFVYRPADGTHEVLFLATGTGIAPFRAMLENAIAVGDTRPMTLYFGLRYFEDIFWDEYFNKLQATHPHFKFVLCLSRPSPSWKGVVGHITDFAKLQHPDLSRACAYLCGNGMMISEAYENLLSVGMQKEHIYGEKFF